MSLRERYAARDLTYSAAHRNRLPELYGLRIGHRLKTCDRDWTEFCNYCREPLALVEEFRDVGQALEDKAHTVTQRLAQHAGLGAFVMAWRVERSEQVQREIDELNRRLRKLEAQHPITEIHAKPLGGRSRFVLLQPDQWWDAIKLMHGEHYVNCEQAQRYGPPITPQRLHQLRADNPLWPEPLGSMILPFSERGF